MKKSILSISAIVLTIMVMFASCTKEDANPTVITIGFSDVNSFSVKASGNVTDDDGSAITVKGIVYGTLPEPVINGANWTNHGEGTGEYTSGITNLSPSTNYHFRAFATNAEGNTFYGEDMTFKTTL